MADYNSIYTGEQIDNAIGRALPNGDIDKKLAEKGALIADKPTDDAILMRNAAGEFSYGYFLNKGIQAVITGPHSKDLKVNAIWANDNSHKLSIYLMTSSEFANVTVKNPNHLYFITE